jgi:hypothetical protein
MFKLLFRSVSIFFGFLLCGLSMAQERNHVGSWGLVAITYVNVETGVASKPWGENPVGQLTYFPSGRMIAVLTADPKIRKIVASEGVKATEERAALYASSSSYTGVWSRVGDTMTHKVDVSVNASWVGKDEVRYLKFDKDILTIETAPIVSFADGKTKNILTLTWKRIE